MSLEHAWNGETTDHSKQADQTELFFMEVLEEDNLQMLEM